MANQFDLFGSKAARDEGMARVAGRAGNFIQDGLSAIARLPVGFTVTGEDIRRLLIHDGIVPHHHNAWGSLIRNAVERQLIRPTGRYLQMRAVASHARRTPEYRR